MTWVPVPRLGIVTSAMLAAGLPTEFIEACCQLAVRNEGFYELMELWLDEPSHEERTATIVALKELLRDAEIPCECHD